MKKEILEVKEGVALTVQNYYHRDYLEDDWSIELVRDNFEEAIKDFWNNEFAESGICVDSLYFFKCKYVIYNENKIVLFKEEVSREEHKLYYKNFNDSKFKEAAIKKKTDLKNKKNKEDKERQEAIKLQQDKIIYEKLKKKFN